MAGVQVRAYNGDTDSAMSYVWNVTTSGTSVSLSSLKANAPSGLTSNYDYSGVRNYSEWISYSGTLFSNLSTSKTNYINLYYIEKDEPPPPPPKKYPYYSYSDVSYTSFKFTYYDTVDYPYLRFYVRDANGNVYHDKWVNTGGTDGTHKVTDLPSGTQLVINVAYNTRASATGSTWLTSDVITTLTIPTYYYKIRYLLPNDTTLSTSGLYSEDSKSSYIMVYTSDISAPSGYQKTGSYTAISGCTYSSSGYFRVTSTNSSSPAILGVYVKENRYALDVYDVYGGTTHYRDSYDLEAGYSFNASVYSSPPYGYEYDHAESPRGTRVTSVTMNADRELYLFYTAIKPTTPSATITVTERTENSLTVRANITNSLTHSDAWYLCISTTSSFSSYQSAQGSGSSITHTFTGLSPNTTYYFKVVNVYNEQQAWQSDYATGTTRRAAFAWDHNDNLDNRRPTANEWTRLVSFVETVAGVTVSAAAKETIYVGGTLSHILFNELAQDVSLAQTVSKGTRILKSVLNALRDKANTLR